MISSNYQKLVTVIVPTFNRSKSLHDSINALLSQTYNNIEIIVSDDCSTDNTVNMVRGFKDKRIVLIKNKKNEGAPSALNIAIKKSKSEVIFFTDDDTLVSKDWVEKGLKYFNDPDVIGIEGKLIYVSPDYKPHFSDRLVENLTGHQFMTANVAYRRLALISCGMFDPTYRLDRYDRDLALRISKLGVIKFASDVIVFHQRSIYTINSFFYDATKVTWAIMLYKKYDDRARVAWIIWEPKSLLAILFPPLILIRFFQRRCDGKEDWKFFLLIYPRLIYERVILWQTAIRDGVFLL